MKSFSILFMTALFGVLASFSFTLPAYSQSMDMLDVKQNVMQRVQPSSSEVSIAQNADIVNPGIDVHIQTGKDVYPGVNIKPTDSSWDISKYGRVDARVMNTGSSQLFLSLRVDNAGDWKDNPWDTESVTISPGEISDIPVYFGYSYGYKPGFKLNSSAVVNMVLFARKSDAKQSFRILSIEAMGKSGDKPPTSPDAIRIKPAGGRLLGSGIAQGFAAQVLANNAQASYTDNNGNSSLQITLPATQGLQMVTFKPTTGRWDLRDDLEIVVKMRNDGKYACTPRVQVDSNGGTTEWVSSKTPIAPGKEGEVIVSFMGSSVIIGDKTSANRITNDTISAIVFAADHPENERKLLVESIQATTPTPTVPDWLGKRPPVKGDWAKTLDEEFNGDSLDQSVWEIYGPNYWDKESHWSKADVIVGNGVVRLRYEKKTGYNDDNPKEKETPYAAGYLHTYGKWAQRYGYFEARMKLPTAPGLWPAFWMMPDRGPSYTPQSGRGDTANGGMEFDVMEHLDRWGPYRYNIAMHWDGYGKDHKSVGSDKIYVQPDKDGYVTCGLLWTPGSVAYYCNGREVLRWDNPRISDVPEDIMFTLPQGGWDNNAIDDSKLPDDFVIDYVRVWQRKDLASLADGKEKPTIGK